jgi:hypothetical protein
MTIEMTDDELRAIREACGDALTEKVRVLRMKSRALRNVQMARDDERLAWARLVKAERAVARIMTEGPYAERTEVEHEAAKQALRDLGVDVDGLLEGPARP